MASWGNSAYPRHDEEKSHEAPTRNNHIHNLSGKVFRNKMVKMFNELTETVGQTSSKIQEDMKETVEWKQIIQEEMRENKATNRNVINEIFARRNGNLRGCPQQLNDNS